MALQTLELTPRASSSFIGFPSESLPHLKWLKLLILIHLVHKKFRTRKLYIILVPFSSKSLFSPLVLRETLGIVHFWKFFFKGWNELLGCFHNAIEVVHWVATSFLIWVANLYKNNWCSTNDFSHHYELFLVLSKDSRSCDNGERKFHFIYLYFEYLLYFNGIELGFLYAPGRRYCGHGQFCMLMWRP